MAGARFMRGKIAIGALRLTGGLFFAVGAIGIFVPLLPTVVFWIVAVYCWSASAPEWSERVLAHPHFGPPIRDFVEHRLLCRRAKVLAIATMAASYAASVWMTGLDLATAVMVGVPLALVALYLATRREQLTAMAERNEIARNPY